MAIMPTPTAEVPPDTRSPIPVEAKRSGEELSVPDIVDIISPSVVQIAVTLGDSSRPGVGTGIVFDDAGHVLTNFHVVGSAQVIKVSLWNGEVRTGHLFREDPLNDLAVIKIDEGSLVPAQFGNSDELRVGEEVIAVGHALGLEGGPTVSKGVVSALDRAIVSSSGIQLSGLIQTDAAINDGNSGGPLVNTRGEVVGMNSSKMSAGEGVGFALNINLTRTTAGRLIALGPLPPPGYLGAFGLDVRPALAAALGLPSSGGFVVTQIDPNSPAADAGIEMDDIIVEVDGMVIRGGADLNNFLRNHTAGEDVSVTVLRGSYLYGFTVHGLEVTLSESP